MYGGILLNDDKIWLLEQYLIAAPFATNLDMGLFTTLTALTDATTSAAIVAAELVVSGYVRQPVNTWSSPVLDAAFDAVSNAAPVTFDNTSGGPTASITGWFYFETVNALCLMAGLFPTPFVIPAGGTFVTTPYYQLNSQVTANP